jgi:ubiquitin-small subunit ribosomal protein S27Ae
MAKKKGGDKKGKTTKGKKHPAQLYKAYEVAGDSAKRKNEFCPKCGVGTYLSKHKDRSHCGKCNYTEFNKK